MTKSQTFLIVCLAAWLPCQLSGQTVLSVGNVPAFPGSTASVPISLRQPAGAVVAAQFDLAYNPARASAGAPVSTARLAGHTVKSREIAPGVWRTLIYSTSNTNVSGTNGPLERIPFTVPREETDGSGPLTPGNAILARADATAMTLDSLRPGAIFVRPINRLPDGSVQFFLPSTNDQRYVIQATTNLIEWINLSTNLATGEFLNQTDVDAAQHPYRFYRWELLTP